MIRNRVGKKEKQLSKTKKRKDFCQKGDFGGGAPSSTLCELEETNKKPTVVFPGKGDYTAHPKR